MWKFVDFGYGIEIDAPGLKLPQAVVNQVRHNAALGHGLAVQAIRARGRAGIKVGPAENIAACVPAIDTPENVHAAEIATREMNGGFLNVILEGRYTDAFLAYAGKNAPKYTADELRIISSPIDFVGLNIYAPQFYVVAAEHAPGFDILPFPGLVSSHQLGMAEDRAGDRLLGAAARGESLESRHDLYQRERHVGGR